MRRLIFVGCAAVCLSCIHNTKDSQRDAERMFVSGKAYECGPKGQLTKVAAGQTIRLVTRSGVLAEDVVAPDGSFVLHPKESRRISDPIYIEAGTDRITLANDWASWMQDHLSWHADVRFGCDPLESAPVDAGDPASESAGSGRAPPAHLLPKR